MNETLQSCWNYLVTFSHESPIPFGFALGTLSFGLLQWAFRGTGVSEVECKLRADLAATTAKMDAWKRQADLWEVSTTAAFKREKEIREKLETALAQPKPEKLPPVPETHNEFAEHVRKLGVACDEDRLRQLWFAAGLTEEQWDETNDSDIMAEAIIGATLHK